MEDDRSDNELDTNPEVLPHKRRKKQIETDSERNEESSNSERSDSSDRGQDESPSDNDSDFLSPKTKKKTAVVKRMRSKRKLNGHSKKREYARAPSFCKQKITPGKLSPRNLRTTRGKRTRYYDHDEDEDDDEQYTDDLGMSSRGRKRRMSYKAKEARVF